MPNSYNNAGSLNFNINALVAKTHLPDSVVCIRTMESRWQAAIIFKSSKYNIQKIISLQAPKMSLQLNISVI